MSDAELRGLDAWIAEYVMKWRVCAHPKPNAPECIIYSDKTVYTVARMSSHSHQLIPFSPATDPAAAMQVLEKCAEKVAIGIGCYGKLWSVRSQRKPHHCQTAEHLPLAICLFARKLFEKERK